MKIDTFFSQKIGNTPNEYEDAFAINPGRGKLAVADGASDSIFSGLWARSLVNSYVESDLSITSESFVEDLVSAARIKWHTDIEWDKLRLFVKNKAINGSFSTMLLVESLDDHTFNKIRVLSVGDSCILFKNGGTLSSFPLSRHEDFNITPKLVWSGYGSPFSREYRWQKPPFQTVDYEIESGDTIVIATDAVSKWLLQFYPDSWGEITDGNKDLKEMFQSEVKDGRMRNDDLTLVKVTIDS